MTKPPTHLTPAYRKRYPLESFDPRFRDVLKKAATETFALTFPTYKSAIEFQRRCYIFRVRCKEANDPQWSLLYRCRLSRHDNVLTFSPYDGEYEDIFGSIGLLKDVQPHLDIKELAPEVQSRSSEPSVMDAFLVPPDEKKNP